MSDIVNLRRVRKRKAAIAKQDAAAENRAKFGRTKTDKARDQRSAEDLARRVEEHRRESED